MYYMNPKGINNINKIWQSTTKLYANTMRSVVYVLRITRLLLGNWLFKHTKHNNFTCQGSLHFSSRYMNQLMWIMDLQYKGDVGSEKRNPSVGITWSGTLAYLCGNETQNLMGVRHDVSSRVASSCRWLSLNVIEDLYWLWNHLQASPYLITGLVYWNWILRLQIYTKYIMFSQRKYSLWSWYIQKSGKYFVWYLEHNNIK